MRLLLMRHGEADYQSATDQERSLTLLGRQQVQQQAAQAPLQWRDFSRVLASPYNRTRHTATLLCEAARQQGATLAASSLALITPDGQCETVQEWLFKQPDLALVLVTHQPFISNFINFLISANESAYIPMHPGSMALLSGVVTARACMQLEWIRHP
jgi:phosphohistidine phosphatase